MSDLKTTWVYNGDKLLKLVRTGCSSLYTGSVEYVAEYVRGCGFTAFTHRTTASYPNSYPHRKNDISSLLIRTFSPLSTPPITMNAKKGLIN